MPFPLQSKKEISDLNMPFWPLEPTKNNTKLSSNSSHISQVQRENTDALEK